MARRVPYIPQLEAVECGAASLAMVLAYHGHHAPLSEVRQACGISRDGSTAKNIVAAARAYGLVPRARRLEPADLAAVLSPAILHWDMNHFVVLERWRPERVDIVDPGEGRRVVASASFDRSFTGICIELAPGPGFARRAAAPVSRARYLALLSGAGRALGMILFASLALNVLATIVPLATQLVVDQVVGRHRVDWLSLIGASAAALVTFSSLYALARGWLLRRVRAHLDVSITRQFVAHLLELPVPFFAQRSLADLMTRVQANRVIREVLAGQSIALLADGTMLLVYLGLMFAFDLRLSLVVVVAALAYLAVFAAAQRRLRAGFDSVQRKSVSAATELLQTLNGIATIKSAGVERSSHRRWLNAWIASINATSAQQLRQQSVTTILFTIQVLVPIVVLWLGGRRVLDGELSPGRLVGFEMLQAGFLGPLIGVVETLLSLQVVPVLLGRMDDVLLSSAEPSGDRAAARLEGEIVLENVRFQYSHTSPAVLSDVSLRIKRGKKVALVGASGSGKSTLARLLLGLYAPTSGRILLDGQDLATLDAASVRRQYGVVLQETALFDGTVAENLRLFSPNAPLEHIVQAARVAQIHDDVMALPRGYETNLAGGGTFSGGQRQRLALARAIVHRPPIMILDEATSALDATTEAAIERYLATRACTRVVIAHRLSTVRDADTIFVLDQGRVVEQGRHDELVALGGHYARLAASEGTARAEAPPPSLRRRIDGAELAAFEAFAAWSDEDRAELAAQLERADFPEATRIVEQDARGAGLFFVASGAVAIELAEPGLAAWTVAELGPGSIVGEISLLDGSPSSASVITRSEVSVLHLPYARFLALQTGGDVVATRTVLSLGAIVAERTVAAIARWADTAPAREEPAADRPTRLLPEAPGPRRELGLAETNLCASLAPAEVDLVLRAGSRVELRAGESLYEEGAPADTLFIVLSGRLELRRSGVGAISDADAGAVLAEAAAFGSVPHPASAVATQRTSALAIRREPLVELLLSGRTATQKLLAPLAETLVRRFRLANFRLREAVALERGELDRAHAAREQALVAAREERETVLARAGGELPVVRVESKDQSGAACLVALLRAAGRAVTLASVSESFAALGGGLHPLEDVARQLGFRTRELEVPLDELTATDAPILGVFGVLEPSMFVLERCRFGTWTVMDPLRGRLAIPHAELVRLYQGAAFELRPEETSAAPASLPPRVAAFVRRRVRDVGRLVAVTLSLQGLALAGSLATALAIQRVFPFVDRPLLGVIVAASFAAGIAVAIMHQLQARAIEHLRAHFDRELLDQLMTHVLKLPISFFDRYPPGEVLQRFQAFENVRQLFSTQGIAALLSVSTIAVSLVLLLAFSSRLALLPLGVAGLYVLATWLLFAPLHRAASDEVRARGRQQERLLEILKGIVTLRMAGDRRAPEQRWLPTFLDELAASLRSDRLVSTALPLLDLGRNMTFVLSIWYGAREVLAGTLSLGALVGFLGVLATFLGAIHGLASQILSSAPSLVDYGLVRSTFAEPREQTADDLVSPGALRGRIAVEGVSFRYTEGSPLVLRDVSLQIEPGEKVALVGSSGSGKSTLGRLLLGLYLPTAGRILFDGRDVTNLDLEALRRRMGVVLQEPFLLAGSLADNISLGVGFAPLPKIVEVAKAAAIHDDIQRMAMGYATRVSEGGTTFSGGQRQRIVIARALLVQPAVLLLDEATSALDNLSQAIIEKNLADSSATRIVIAHRLSTIMDADRIVVLHKGRIVEQGTHDELFANRGAYHELVRAQLAD